MFLSFDTSKPPYCSFFNVCHCIVIHCLATKHSCTASSHSTGTLHTVIHLHHHSIQSHCSDILQHHYTLQSYSTVTLCTAIHLHHQSIQSHTPWSFSSCTLIQCGHTAVTLYCHTSSSEHTVTHCLVILQSYSTIIHWSHTAQSHCTVIHHH